MEKFIIVIGLLLGLNHASKCEAATTLNCREIGANLVRCENDEVICYGLGKQFGTSIDSAGIYSNGKTLQCKFKEDKPKLMSSN